MTQHKFPIHVPAHDPGAADRTIEVSPRELSHLIAEGAVRINTTASLPIFFEKLAGAYTPTDATAEHDEGRD